jgi:hypothetical protein
MEQVTLKLIGASPLIMHSDVTVDPLHPTTQAIADLTATKKKTTQHHIDVGRLELQAGLYMNADGPYLPSDNIFKAIVEAGRMTKTGKQIERGVMIFEDAKLEYDGPRDAAGIASQKRFSYRKSVVVGGRRIMRTRPKFDEWAAVVTVQYDPTIINKRALIEAATKAGQYIGLCERRPNKGGKFGTFTVEEVR